MTMFLQHCFFPCIAVAIYSLIKGQINVTLATNLCGCIVSCVLAYIVKSAVSTFIPRRHLPCLQEKGILITGCDTGFGNKLARSLDSLGVTVYAACLLPDGPDAQELKKSSSETLHIVPLDVTKDEDVEAALQYVKSTLGDKKLWAVVNNAGIGTNTEIEWLPIHKVKQLFEVNTFGTIRVTNAFLPLLRQSKGRVVNVASVTVYWPLPYLVFYSMAKTAIKAFTQGLGYEMQKFSISVHSIEPCAFSTNFTTSSMSSLNVNWNNTKNHIKLDYGLNYMESLKTRMNTLNRFFCHPESKLYLVVNDMLDACIGISPKDYYVPGNFGELIRIILKLTPNCILSYVAVLLTQQN